MMRVCSNKTALPRLGDAGRACGRFAGSLRLALGAVAVGGTAAYAASFRTLPGAAEVLGPLSASIGVAAGVSWLILGAVLLHKTRATPAPAVWADACLRTMAAGIAVLTAGTAANLILGPSASFSLRTLLIAHGVILAAAQALMCVAFVREARRLGLTARAAIATWLFALDLPFALMLMTLYRTGVLKP